MKKRLLLGIALSLVAGLVIGGYGGFRLGKSSVLNNVLQKDAREVQSHVSTLKYLRDGQTDKAIEVIEAGLDDDLVLFDPEEPYEMITDRTKAEIKQALQQARGYRAAYPRKSSRSYVDTMVGNVLEKEALR
jgi:hypothetical protein